MNQTVSPCAIAIICDGLSGSIVAANVLGNATISLEIECCTQDTRVVLNYQYLSQGLPPGLSIYKVNVDFRLLTLTDTEPSFLEV
ncbi:hypothetical protein PCC6912_42130 [Chlorogloeopsis fritschii PCC 6912]|uniref:Uncharacterized protein n=1 Tax=Chlorogloeopsis fritschii PCC 6912 TaxID=211165 RepID=A0A3S1FF00_CHLFR|nr:hypothetical protein PCC6912_42130 [Chlorogloeopsis fritschii PCC 6912]